MVLVQYLKGFLLLSGITAPTALDVGSCYQSNPNILEVDAFRIGFDLLQLLMFPQNPVKGGLLWGLIK